MNKALKAVAAAAGLGMIGAATSPLSASDPASSSVTVPAAGGQAGSAWAGTVPVGPPTVSSQCSKNQFADAHELTVSVPDGFYDTRTSTFEFTITWTPSNPQAQATYNDLIITVLDAGGNLVVREDTSATTETAKAADLKTGTYTVLACGFLNSSAQPYKGSVKVTTAAKSAAVQAVPRNPNSKNDNLLRFTEATVVDPVLFGGEPGINFDPTTADGSRSFVDWPVSSRVNIGVLFRSDDGGLTYRKRYADPLDAANAGLTCGGRQVPMCTTGGGGDTDVNINAGNGNLYFTSQEVLVAQAVATSFDAGVSFPTDHTDPVTASAPCTGVDRQWLSSWKGTDTVFLSYHVPIVGQCVARSDDAGATGSWVPPTLGFTNVTQSGAMIADNTGGIHDKTLYVAYVASALGQIGTYELAVSRDGGGTWDVRQVPSDANVRNFNKVITDNVGNLYATWVDSATQHTWLSTSLASDPANVSAPGTKWSKPVVVEGEPVTITIFPDVVAGAPGRVAVAYYATSAPKDDPNNVLPGEGGWYPYVSTSYDALCQWDNTPCASPTFHQSVISHQANHDDNICTSGTTCIVLPSPSHPGNRNLLDFFDISLDGDGYLGFVWGDTRNAIGLPFVKVARQSSGPSLYHGKPGAFLGKRVNGVADVAGDALYPIAGKKLLTATNHAGLDLLGTTLSLKDASTLEVRMRVADETKLGQFPAGPDDLTPLQQSKFITRWDFNGQAYYAGANVARGSTTPTFFSGVVSPAEGMSNGTNSVFGNTYAPLTSAKGRVEDGAVVIEVPLSAVGSPTVNSPFFSVGSYALVGAQDSLTTLYTAPITVDATPTFDVALAGPGAADILNPGGGGGGGTGGGGGPLPATGGWPLAALLGAVAAAAGGGLWVGRRRWA